MGQDKRVKIYMDDAGDLCIFIETEDHTVDFRIYWSVGGDEPPGFNLFIDRRGSPDGRYKLLEEEGLRLLARLAKALHQQREEDNNAKWRFDYSGDCVLYLYYDFDSGFNQLITV